jgi:hypothetical protein
MKKTCNGCKALWYHAERNVAVCVLDHEINDLFVGAGEYTRPLEECPKPKSKKQLFECLKNAGKVTQV